MKQIELVFELTVNEQMNIYGGCLVKYVGLSSLEDLGYISIFIWNTLPNWKDIMNSK